MGYAPLYFEIPTPTYDPTKMPPPTSTDDGSQADPGDGSSDRGLGLSVFGPSNTVYRMTPLPPVRWTGPIVSPLGPIDQAPQMNVYPAPSTPPSTGAEATFVPVGPNQMLNLNTGDIVDGETANNIAQAASSNPSILTAPIASVPPSLLSAAMQAQLKAGTVATAQSTGIIPGGTSWWTQTTNLFGMVIPNWGLLAGAGGGLFLLLGGGSGGRRGRR